MQSPGNEKKICTTCGGTGQIACFHGESRFLLSQEECPACFGIGYAIDQDESTDQECDNDNQAD